MVQVAIQVTEQEVSAFGRGPRPPCLILNLQVPKLRCAGEMSMPHSQRYDRPTSSHLYRACARHIPAYAALLNTPTVGHCVCARWLQ